MIVGLFAKTHRVDFAEEFREILRWLEANDCGVAVESSIVQAFGLEGIQPVPREEIPERADAIVVFGGDGTMLSVARLIQGERCPILGVNLGSLGFLTEVTLDRLYSDLRSLLDGSYHVEERRLLKAVLKRGGGKQFEYHALNDVVINKAALARVISVDAFFNESFIANFVADGMIVSTPTGSTAYSLSAGGPIVYPTLDCIVMTPICPHTLTNRPLIVPADHELRFLLRSGKDVMLTVDGQIGEEYTEGDEVVCTLSPYRVELVRPGARSFFDTLRDKLKWGKR